MTPLTSVRGPTLEGATVVVIGYGRSGRAAAGVLERCGAKVRVTDTRGVESLGVAPDEVPGGIEWLGRADDAVLASTDLVVASPGVPPSNPVLARALDGGRPVHSELELGWWFTEAPIVAVTGTNGKTTTAELIGAMGRAARCDTVVAGNVGTPLSSLAGQKSDLIVLEVSSFQLFLCRDFRPHVGALLNLTPDHLDWHPDLEHYAAAKANLFARQVGRDAAVVNAADPGVTAIGAGVPSELYEFRLEPPVTRGAWIRDERLVLRTGDEPESLLPLSEWSLPGRHNRENLLAAALCARLIGLPDEAIRRGAREFRGLPHRMELVAEAGGVQWINDSKSTNPGSLVSALDPDVPTLLIAGGLTKGVDVRPLKEPVARGARLAILIGEGAVEMERAWRGAVRTVVAGDLETAVRIAVREADVGDRVLLSPGCASFDQFENYVQRGDCFREIVRRITSEGGEA